MLYAIRLMKAGRIATLKQAQAFLQKHYLISNTIGGLSDLFKHQQIKLKTGRKRCVGVSAAKQTTFKKQLRTIAGGLR